MATQSAIQKTPTKTSEDDEPVLDITGVDQEPPDDKQQDPDTPDENQNESDINYGTEEVGDPIEDIFQSNDYLQSQEKTT